MTLSGLNIGGAETHVVELSKKLSQMGVKVVVASSGGVYEKELTDAGILHVNVPLSNKNIFNMIKSYKLLERVIKENHIEIVHAHARIPAFLCGRLHKLMHFRFVTTAHFDFSTKFPLNLLSDWGEATLTVGADIKKYLMENYHIPEKRIHATVNGIDTEKFAPSVDFSDAAKEFGFADKKRIVYLSRMDENACLAAKKLMEIAGSLGDVEIVAVGGGNDFENVSRVAEEVNRRAGERRVIMTGARTDVNKFLSSADVFVGVSRAALEAMACGKPLVLAGNEGYLGIFDGSKLPQAVESNFTCRGAGPTTAEKLKKDLLNLLGRTPEELGELGKFGRKTIIERYSVERMANDALDVYDRGFGRAAPAGNSRQ